MISEIVLFRLPKEMSRDEAITKYRARIPAWQGNPDLTDEASHRGGGVYLWTSIEAAKKAHGPAYHEAVQSIYGATPEFQYFEALVVIDNNASKCSAQRRSGLSV